MGSSVSFYSLEGHMISLGPAVFFLFSEKIKTLPPLYKKKKEKPPKERKRKEKPPPGEDHYSILDYVLLVIHYAQMYWLSIAA